MLFLLNDSGLIHMVPSIINDTYVIRFCVNSSKANIDDIHESWNIIQTAADTAIYEYNYQFKSESPEIDKRKGKDLCLSMSMTRLKKKSIVRMVSDPIKFRSLNSLNMFNPNNGQSLKKLDEATELDEEECKDVNNSLNELIKIKS